MKIMSRKVAITCRNLLIGILAPLALTLMDWPMREALKPSNILLVYLLGVFFLALRLGLLVSFVASITSAAAFAFFFAPPIFSFAIADQENLIGLTVMLIVGAITSQQAEDVITQSRLANQRERRASALYHLSKELAAAPLENEIIEIGVRHIHAEFGSRSTILLPDRNSRLTYPANPPSAISLRGTNLATANSVFQQAQSGSSPGNNPLQATAFYLPLIGSTGPIGLLLLEQHVPPRILPPEQRQLLDTFVNQIVHTLERARLAEQAREATLKIQAETLRNSLLSSISHDLRTPLATIIGAASTLDTDHDRLSSGARQNLVQAISEEAYRMSDLTTKILQMARLEAGEVVLNRQWYEPEEIVGSALRRLETKLKNRPVNIRMTDSQSLINVDAVLLQQVMVNLLDNADKYSPGGQPIDISVDITPANIIFSIADRGPGIPIEMQQKIFEKFFQIHAESAQSGAGLGLSICRAIVEAHQGEIWVNNRDEGGAVMQVRLPLLEPPPAIDPED